MAECNWDPSKHGGKPCPVHGAEGGKETVANRKQRLKELGYDSDKEDTKQLRQRLAEARNNEYQKSRKEMSSKDWLEKQKEIDNYYDTLDEYVDTLDEDFEDEPFDDDNDFENWEDEDDPSRAVSVAEDELGIDVLDSYENYEQVCDWLVDNGYAEDFGEADEIIKNSLSAEGLVKLNEIYDDWASIDDLEEDLGINNNSISAGEEFPNSVDRESYHNAKKELQSISDSKQLANWFKKVKQDYSEDKISDDDFDELVRFYKESKQDLPSKGTVTASRRKPETNDYQLSVDPDVAAKAINSDHKRANYYIDFLYDDFDENINNKNLDKENTKKYWQKILGKIDDSKIRSNEKLKLMKAALDYDR